MNTRNLAWGVTGGVSFLLALACGGTKINDVGNADDGRAGSGGSNVGGRDHSEETGGVGGTGIDYVAGNTSCGGSSAYAGNGFDYGCTTTAGTGFGGNYENTAGTGFGGYYENTAGTGFGGYFENTAGYANTAGTGTAGYGGVGGGAADCFAPPNGYAEAPTIAPQNMIFVDTHGVASDVVRNYADQQVFTNIGWLPEVYANFPASPAATDTTLSLPAELAEVGANLGQVYVTRANCADKPAAGHKLTVEFWWKHGAVGVLPTHGVALGAVSNQGKAVWFGDSARTYLSGDAQTKRLTNTLNRLVVQHTFAENDPTDAGQVTLGVWLLPDAEFASTLYIGAVKWD